MEKRTIGATGVRISVLGLGTMYFGSRMDEKASFRLLDLYVGHGGNFLDSANKYASWVMGFQGGESEHLIGKWLKQRSRKEALIISSKVGFPYGDIPRSLKKEIIISECERSLKRLGLRSNNLKYKLQVSKQSSTKNEKDPCFNEMDGPGCRHRDGDRKPAGAE